MRMYFSGVASAVEARMLIQAGVRDWLADPVDFQNLPVDGGHSRVLDSGAYRAFKRNETLDVAAYVGKVADLMGARQVDWAVAPDVIGDYVASRRNWREVERMKAQGLADQVVIHPVFQWGAPWRELEWYARRSTTVCIGGLVPLMRAKDKGVLAELLRIAVDYPSLHFLGLNWLKAIEDLAGSNHTCDTSKWLDAARYGHVIFTNTRTGHLSQAPAKVLKLDLDLDRESRCIQSARAMRDFLMAA